MPEDQLPEARRILGGAFYGTLVILVNTTVHSISISYVQGCHQRLSSSAFDLLLIFYL